MFGFGPASTSEQVVYGAQRPGYPDEVVRANTVDEWLGFMRHSGMQRVVCLLSSPQLKFYEEIPGGLLACHVREFGKSKWLHAPIEDYHLCDSELLLERILPFLRDADVVGEKTVVHCSGGSGRTGHVLAAWHATRRLSAIITTTEIL